MATNILQNIAGGIIGRTGRGIQALGTMYNLPQATPGGVGAQLQIIGRQLNPVNPPPAKGGELIGSVFDPYKGTQSTQGYANPTGGVKGASTTGGNFSSNIVPAGNDILQSNINQQTGDLGSIIDNDYNTTMGALASQEGDLRSSAGVAMQQAEAGYAPARTELQNTQNTNLSGLAGQEVQAQNQQSSGMQQARDLFRQTQQQNIAQLSGLGISSSSVMEALAEKLGVETARRIGNLAQSTNDVLNNIAGEKTRVKSYFGQKMTDLEAQIGAAKSNIQQKLLEGINQINSARNQAANDKANQRIQLISNAQTALAQIQAKAQDFQQQLTLWNQQKTAALNDAAKFVVTPTDFSALNQAANEGVNAIAGAGLQGYQPTFSIAPSGYVTTQYKPKEEDLLSKYGIAQ